MLKTFTYAVLVSMGIEDHATLLPTNLIYSEDTLSNNLQTCGAKQATDYGFYEVLASEDSRAPIPTSPDNG